MANILLVEDDPLIIRLYQKTLEFEHHNVRTAENGVKALEVLQEFRPDAILLDIMMPEMNGVQFLEKMNGGSDQSAIPVIVLTNVSDSDVTLSAVNAGAALILIKSQTEPDDVIDAVNKVLNKEILQTGDVLEAEDQQAE